MPDISSAWGCRRVSYGCGSVTRVEGFTVQRISENDSMQPRRDLYLRTTEFSVCVCECELSRRTDCLWDEKSLERTSDTAG